MDRFERALQEKIKIQPDRNFDQRFFAKLELEFEKDKHPSLKGWRQRFTLRWVGVAVALLVVAVGTAELVRRQRGGDPLSFADASFVTEMLDAESVLEDAELLVEFDQMPLSEEDWAVLEQPSGETDES